MAMSLHILANLNGLMLADWAQLWPFGAGVVAAGLAGGLGWLIGRGSRTERAPAAPDTKARDPFVDGSHTEQRRSLRREGSPIEIRVATSEVGKAKPFQAWVIDRSVGGVCLDSHSAYKEGAQLFLMPVNAPETTPWIDVEVRSCRPSKDGYEIGCRFVKTPPWAILLLFG
jgi:hypothetical protein